MAEQSEIPSAEILEALASIVKSQIFSRQPRQAQLLDYLVKSAAAGGGRNLKAFSIAVDVFGRDENFDQSNDAIVRVHVGRLRAVLNDYYSNEGRNDAIRIAIPKGSYCPTFSKVAASLDNASGNIEKSGAGSSAGHSNTGGASPSEPQARRDATLTSAEETGTNSKTSPSSTRAAPTVLALALITLALAFMYKSVTPSEPPQSGSATLEANIDTIAVLPFIGEGGTPELQSRASEIERTLIGSLSGDKGLNIKLAPPLRSNRATADDFTKLNRTLGARWVISGLMHPEGETEHLDIQIVDTSNGRVVWDKMYEQLKAETFDTKKAVLKVGLDIYPQIMGAKRSAAEQAHEKTASAATYHNKANWAWGEAQASESWEVDRVTYARQAVKLNPLYGPAYGVLADKLAFLANVSPKWDKPEFQTEARQAADKALELAPLNADTVLNVALYHLHTGNFSVAKRYFDRAQELNPFHPLAVMNKDVRPFQCGDISNNEIKLLKDFESSLAPSNPVRWVPLYQLAKSHVLRGEYHLAAETGLQAEKLFLNPIESLWVAAALAKIDKTADARSGYERIRSSWPSFTVDHYIKSAMPRLCAAPEQLAALRETFAPLEAAVRN